MLHNAEQFEYFVVCSNAFWMQIKNMQLRKQ